MFLFQTGCAQKHLQQTLGQQVVLRALALSSTRSQVAIAGSTALARAVMEDLTTSATISTVTVVLPIVSTLAEALLADLSAESPT